MSNPNHPWCQDVSRDEALRAAEDAAAVPAIMHRDLPDAVAELRERVAKLEQTARPCGGTDPASSGCAPGEAGTGLRTERVTLEVTHDSAYPAAEWVLEVLQETCTDPGESFSVVDETEAMRCMTKLRRERDAALRVARVILEATWRPEKNLEPPAEWRWQDFVNLSGDPLGPGESVRVVEEARARGGRLPDMVAWITAERDAARAEAERLRARVAELEDEEAADAGGKQQEPRGWLTAEERSLLESLRATFQENADVLRSDGSVGHAENWERRVRILDAILDRSTPPPRVKVPHLDDLEADERPVWESACKAWIAAISEAGGEVE